MKAKRKILLTSALSMLIVLFGCSRDEITVYTSVDLGLSVNWAEVNVGARTRDGLGNYYAWGEVLPKEDYSMKKYKWNKEGSGYTKYLGDDRYVLESEDDVATIEWGDGWRMPTEKEMQELFDNCTWTWSTLEGMEGYKVTSRVKGYEGKYIFLPAAGFWIDKDPAVSGCYARYWCASRYEDNGGPYALVFSPSEKKIVVETRYYGFSVRPVRNK